MYQLKKTVSLILVAAMLLSLVVIGTPVTASAAPVFETVGGWNETLYATIKGISDADVTAVSYSGPTSGTLSGEDFDYLVRSTTGGVRLDILGLKAGTYTLTVETTSGTVTQSGIEVPAQDRSGFAHDGYTEGVGAYNDDGTLKANAIVLYVTNSNKNSLELSCGGVTVNGIGHILNSAGKEATPGSGTTSKGGIANNNQGILQKLAEADIPLVVRIIGNVTTPDGVTEFDSVNYGGIDNDNGSMCRMTNCKNITIEGVGASAIANGWGFSFIAGTGDYALGYGKNFEVRNIRFENVPEDCVGLEGQQVGDELTDPIQHCWIHNNTYVSPYFPDAPEADKRNGDGACDWKRGLYYTNSFNYYDGYKKTNLVGSNDDCLQYHATFHHNYWDDCAARAPLARQADVHMYNNIWYSMVDYCISPRASSYVFYEYGYFVDNGDVLETSGDTDGYGNVYENNKSDPSSSEVTDRMAAIRSGELAGTYVERGDYSLQTDIEEMKATVYSQAGSQRASGSSSLDPDAPADESQTGTAGGFIHNFTLHGKESAFYTITGELATNKGKVTYNNLTLTQCLVMNDTSASVSFTAPVAGTLTMVFGGSTSDKNNKVLLDGSAVTIGENQFTVDVSAGDHTVVKSDVVHLWYIAYVPSEEVEEPTLAPTEHVHSYTSKVTPATCTEAGVTTYTCSCGDSYTESIAALGHSYDNGYCTRCGAQDPNATHSHTYTSTVTPPTCTAEGYTTYQCVCGDSYVSDTVAALGHSYVSKVTAPTCTAGGYTTYTCSGCGDSYTGNNTAATGHSYTASVVAPTCTAQGYTAHTCSVCGDSYKDTYVDAAGHKYANGVCSVCGRSESVSSDILAAAGHLESAYVEWKILSGVSGYNVYVKKSGGSWVQLDNELIRQYPDRMRADAVGLAAGSYQLKVVPLVGGEEQTAQALETEDLTVLAHDRSGYAHYNGYNVGAYNADGTLKSNAKVFYITADTVNTVTITENNKTYTGLGKLVKEYARTTSYPIVIRIIGEIPVPSATTNGQIEVKGNIVPVTIEGIGADATCNGWGFKLSSCENVEVRNLGFMNNVSSEGDSMTLQGATHSWVHNCDFFYGEPGSDADQVKGDGALDTKQSTYITHSYNHFWDCGKVNLQGSNSSDTSNYITYHHNWYDHSDSRHPRVRIASVHVYNNYYDGNAGYGVGAACASDVFVENNYFRNCNYPMLISDQGSDTTETMSGEPGGMIKAYGNVIVDATSFIPYSENSTSFDAYVASSRDEVVPSTVKAANGSATYNNFDTASDFYDYEVDTAQVGAEKTVAYSGRVGGGDFQWEFTSADDEDEEVNLDLKNALLNYETTLVSVGGNSVITEPSEDPTEPSEDPTEPSEDPTEPSEDPTEPSSEATEPSTEATEPSTEATEPSGTASKYIHNFTTDGSTSEFYTITGTLSTGKGSTSYNGLSLTRCLMLDKTSSTVSFNAPSSGKLTMVFGGSTSDKNKKVMINGTGYTIDANNQVSIDIEAGSYTITRGSSSLNLWYVEYAPDSSDVHTHSYTAAVTAPTCDTAGYTTYTCSCGHSYTADKVAALSHSYSSAVTTAPSCEGTGVRTYTCGNCGDSYTESIAALGHSYKAVVTAPTCTAAGYTTYTCSVCGSSYTSNEVAATGHSYVDGICSVCGASDPEYVAPVDLFKLSGANVVLGNDLTMNFALLASNLNGTDYYAEIVKYNPDGTTTTTTYPFSSWTAYGPMYLITLDGLVAKQMSDKVEVTVYTGDGVQASYTWVDSIRDYSIRQLNADTNSAKVKTCVADMLNYGAAAQVQFNYNTSDLANATMTDTHKSYETKTLDFSQYTNNQVVGDNFFGTILALETNIKMGVFFRGTGYEGYTAKVSYRDHNGNAVSYEVAGKDFDATYAANGMYGIMVDTLVAGDVYQVVTVEVYNGSTLVASVSESLESYVVRQSASLLPIYDALMKFMVSSYNYSH